MRAVQLENDKTYAEQSNNINGIDRKDYYPNLSK